MFDNLDSHIKEENWVRVLGIDPGTRNMGVAVIDVNLLDKSKFKLVYSTTVYGEMHLYDIPEQFDDINLTGIAARSFALTRVLQLLIDIFEPDIGIIEDNYLGMSPLTYKQLVQFVSMATESFREVGVFVSYVFPNVAKEIVNANFRGTQKEDVKTGLLKYKHLFNKNKIDLKNLDEHAIDACVVALYRCEQMAKDYDVFVGS